MLEESFLSPSFNKAHLASAETKELAETKERFQEKYNADESKDKRAFKKFYSEFILQKAEEFNQRLLTEKGVDATSFYTYFTSTVPEFTENTTEKEIQLLIDNMNLKVFELLKIQNGKKFLEFLTNNDIEKNKRVVALAAHFSPSLNKPINHYRELVRRNIKVWEDIQQDCKGIINEVERVENHPEVDGYYIRSIAEFVETESSKIDIAIRKNSIQIC